MSKATVTAPEHGRLARWRHGTFGPASDEPFRRRAPDVVRVVVAVVALAVLISHAGHPTRTEQTLFEFFNSLPSTLKPLFELLYGLGVLWAVGIVVAAALVARRWRLAGTMLLTGSLTWLAARLVGSLVSGASFSDSIHAVLRLDTTQAFPLVRPSIRGTALKI